MRLRSSLCIVMMGAALLLGSVAPVFAQNYGVPANSPYPQQRRDLRAYPPGYYPGKLVRPAQPGFSLRQLFGGPEQVEPQPQVRRPRRAPPRAPAVARQQKPKADPTTQVIVVGDAMAEYAGQGISDLFADSEEILVIRKIREQSGLVGTSATEWGKLIDEAVGTGKKTNVAVVMLGHGDRQNIKQDQAVLEPLTEPWRRAYSGKVDAVMAAFAERRLPVVWIGLPPARNAGQTEDHLAINEIFRESVVRNGGSYVDIWPGFVDEDNRYAVSGPDIDGQTAKLRANDGMFFTKAGSRKIALFAEPEIKRLIDSDQPAPAVVSVPSTDAPPAVDPLAAIADVPDDVAPVSLPMKPLVGPVLPLNQAVVTPGGTLLGAAPKLSGDQAYTVRRALREGVAPPSRPGRADDFRWPPS